LSRQTLQLQILAHAPTQARQRVAERDHPFELLPIAYTPPLGMVTVLLAVARVASGRL